jgi:hypothetical protein
VTGGGLTRDQLLGSIAFLALDLFNRDAEGKFEAREALMVANASRAQAAMQAVESH